MFCSTFYSFKGGVGRTLALINVAALLAQKGKKVLIVDFDLEAPGLATFKDLNTSNTTPGIVDYVTEYLRTSKAPELDSYIQQCELKPTKKSRELAENSPIQIDLMSAGKADGKYAARLAQINWNRLYEQRHGFLLMEDLREKWRIAGYDYVLIDSRTGHTDVGGICTRQLPDAVISVFFPNRQNLSGLEDVVRDIRASKARGNSEDKKIDTIFVASRVPNLDDEDDLLRKWLYRFQTKLAYQPYEFFLIQHYDSLMLLDQSLFAVERPRTALAKQYNELANGISRLNVEDADGQLDYIRLAEELLYRRRSRENKQNDYLPELFRQFGNRLESIAEKHPDDCILQYELAIEYRRRRSWIDATIAIDRAIASAGKTETSEPVDDIFFARAHRLRLNIKEALGDGEAGLASAKSILSAQLKGDVSVDLLTDALQYIANTHPEELDDQMRSGAIVSASTDDLMKIAKTLSESPSSFSFASAIAIELLDRSENLGKHTGDYDNLHELQLILIGDGHFSEAMTLFKETGPVEMNLPELFNCTMAKWGRDGSPDLDWFKILWEKFDTERPGHGANYWQCRALCAAVLGLSDNVKEAVEEALDDLRLRPRALEFSCWTYHQVSKDIFEQHLNKILTLATTKRGAPGVFEKSEAGE